MSEASEVTAAPSAVSDTVPNGEDVKDETAMEAMNEETSKDEVKSEEAAEEIANYAVFVMNLPATATEEDIRKHFEEKTPVKSITLMYSPTGRFCGYANVELPDKAGYEAALDLMGSDMNGACLYVIPHRTLRQPEMALDDSKPYKVLISNIPSTATEDDVRKHFEKEVSVQNLTFIQSSDGKFYGYATMEIPDKEAYEAALKMSGSALGDVNLIVNPHKSMIKRYRDKDEARPLKILISNISKSVGLMEAKRHFYPAGLIRRFIPRTSSKAMGKDGLFKNDWSATVKVNTMDTYANFLKMDGIVIGGQAVKVEPLVLDKKGAFKRLAECCEGDGFSKKPKLEESEDESEPDNPLKLFIGHIPPMATSDDLLEHMKQAGEVVKHWVPDEKMRKKSKIGFVIMADEEGKQKALELSGTPFMGSLLKIQPFMKGRGPYGRIFAEPEWIEQPNVVIVSNIPQKCTEEALRQHFESAGTIKSVRFPRDHSLTIAYMEMADKESYEKVIQLSNTFMDEYCVKVMEASSNLVPKMWLNLKAQQEKMKSVKKNRKRGVGGDMKKGRKFVNNKGNLPAMLTPREIKRREKKMKRRAERLRNADYVPSYQMNAGGRVARNLGPQPLMDGFGRSLFSQAWSENDTGMFRRSGGLLEVTQRKEIEVAVLTALSELGARKSTSNNYLSPNTSYSSNYSYSGNTFGLGNSYSSNNNTYGRSSNTLGFRSNTFGSSSNTFGSSSSFSSTNNYGSNNSYNRANSFGSGSGSYNFGNSSYYQRK